jgi:NTP pyrophosphatase (non-canonical NTP hydrolase)
MNRGIAQHQIGSFVDGVAGHVRTPKAVAGRLVEEVVELALASGMNAGDIMAHVADSLHNQALKSSVLANKTVFPSQVVDSGDGRKDEAADVSLVLKDYCHVAGIDLSTAEAQKFSRFTNCVFTVTEQGTIYAIKPHVR